jgi:hypothetical protein
MKGVILSKSFPKRGGSIIYSFMVSFFFRPFTYGIYGFVAFFTVLILTKSTSYLLGFTEQYTIGGDDVFYSVLGFVLVFLIRLSESIKTRATNKMKI